MKYRFARRSWFNWQESRTRGRVAAQRDEQATIFKTKGKKRKRDGEGRKIKCDAPILLLSSVKGMISRLSLLILHSPRSNFTQVSLFHYWPGLVSLLLNGSFNFFDNYSDGREKLLCSRLHFELERFDRVIFELINTPFSKIQWRWLGAIFV